MKKSLTKLFRRMEMEKMTPQQWTQVLIQTVPKKGSCLEMDNKRGLFLTEFVSKVYEKILKSRNEAQIGQYMSNLQTGGVKKRATVDNHIILSEIIRKNRKLGKKTYIVYGDAVKCFDKLWLKDALVELYKAGCSPQDVCMIYEMNKDTEISVVTPMGRTEKAQVGDIVKQGTVLGPTLCCVETDQINSIGESQMRPFGNQVLGILVFVDDVMSAGTAEDARKCIRNLQVMEVLKKFTYGLKKTNFMVIDTGKEQTEIIDEKVKEGLVKECQEYEYLGFWVNQQGNCQLQIEKRSKKIKGEIAAIKSMASYHNVGPTYLNVRLQLYECCILPSLLYNLEGWNKISKTEMKKLESVQLKSLCSLLQIPKTTPYLGLLNELGIWTIEERLKYRKIMLYHNLMNSDDKRIAKNMIVEQKLDEDDDTFYMTTMKMAKTLNMDINNVDGMTKASLKRQLKEEIGKSMLNTIRQVKMKKLRFVGVPSVFEKSPYIAQMDAGAAIQVIKTKLNMLPIYGNYKGNLTLSRPCPLCEEVDDTTEHLVSCSKLNVKGFTSEDLKDNSNIEKWRQINELVTHNMEKRRILAGYNERDRLT